MTKFSGSLFTITNDLYSTYSKLVEDGVISLSFSEYQDRYFDNPDDSTTYKNRLRTLNRHLEKKDAVKQRLRKKLAEKKKINQLINQLINQSINQSTR